MSQSQFRSTVRDHGGNLDATIARYGGSRAQWVDLSTGINPEPYPLPDFDMSDWTALPDSAAQSALLAAAREFWGVSDEAAILAAPGASALIARLPALGQAATVRIETPTYNEHAAAFSAQGWDVTQDGPAQACVLVHPNNPDGRTWSTADVNTPLTIIDESFCDICPDQSLVHLAAKPGVVVLKSFGKFWGLAGLRLGFAIAHPDTIAKLADLTGPWAVSGPALRVGTQALNDADWAQQTRARLARDAKRLDQIVEHAGGSFVGGTDLFRLYNVTSAQDWQDRLARHRVWSRIFPYSDTYLRLGMPPASGWGQLEAALT
jgi:cobalamin biosynthetic protein CobC